MDLSGTRTLHIVEPWSGMEPSSVSAGRGCDTLLAACALACRTTPGTHSVCLLGPAFVEQRARKLLADEQIVCRISPPLGRPELAGRAADRVAGSAGPFDLIVCWGGRVGRLARRLRRHARSVVTAVLTADGGVPTLRRGPGAAIMHLAPPLMDATVAESPRRRWRRSMGIDDAEIVLGMLDDPALGGNARRFVFLLGTLSVAGQSVVGLMPSGAREQARARRFQRGVSPRTRVIAMDRPAQALLGECDVAVLFDPPDHEARHEGSSAGVAAFNLALAGSLGVPVVVPDSSFAAVLPSIRHDGRPHVAASSHPTDIGRVAHELVMERRKSLQAGSAARPASPLTSVVSDWQEQFASRLAARG